MTSPGGPPHRVLVVDDSAFARKVLREILGRDSRLEVVGFARDGIDALEKIEELKPDVITLDLMMPELDGLGVLEALHAQSHDDDDDDDDDDDESGGGKTTTPPPPRVVVVTMTDAESEKGIAALSFGAFDIVHKPTALATDRLYELEKELIEKVALAARSSSFKPRPHPTAPKRQEAIVTKTNLLVIGASTGGPRALAEILAALPASFPVPIAAVVHMPEGYTNAFAARLDAGSQLTVIEASDGQTLEPGTVILARAGIHLCLKNDAETPGGKVTTMLTRSRARIRGPEYEHEDNNPALHRPSVDMLFESAAKAVGDGCLGVVLTGMGSDGLAGAKAIHRAGGKLIIEAESSCVVYGMPRAIAEAKLGAHETPLDRIPQAIFDRL